jgi:hypothetical protein
MKLRISRSSKEINPKNRPKELLTENSDTGINKKLKNNYSQKKFFNYNKYILTTLSTEQINNIKNEILKKLTQKNNNIIPQNIKKNNQNNKKKIKKDSFLVYNQKLKKKFELYNKDNLAYNIYHDYQKINFDHNETPFLKRMELYSIKKNIKEEKIEEFINKKIPKVSENEKNEIFKRLINDAEKRKNNKNKFAEIELYYNNALNKKQKKVNQKELNEIVKRLSTPKKEKINLNIIKPNNNSHRNIFINGGNNNNIKLNNNNNDINCKINKKSNKIKNSFSSKNIERINQRLYYKEMNKKDFKYKLFMSKVHQLIKYKNNNINKDINNNNNDYINYEQLKSLRNNKMLNIKTLSNNNFNNNAYTFKDDEDIDDDNNKRIKTQNNFNYDNKKNNELFSFSKPKNNINNLKISLIIDNFFYNK